MAELKKLRIDWADLELAFMERPDLFATGQDVHYFDRETGRVVFLDEVVRSAIDAIEEELEAAGLLDRGVTPEVIRDTRVVASLADIERDLVLAAAEMHFGDPSRFEEIPKFTSRESYGYMEDFIDTVSDPAMRKRLRAAITRDRPFRRFRSVLAQDRPLERQWRIYEDRREREAMIAWLRSIGVEPVNPEEGLAEPPPLPELRKIMFKEVLQFVRRSRELPGVLRIALIGSLAADKQFPNDVNMLVTVADDCDLAPLAKLARQLNGHMVQYRSGAEVFLADPQGRYLGRTCPWKRCGPGVRQSCHALHCGLRPYLHDDLDAVRLPEELIASPPVVLWPNPSASPRAAQDVHTQLIEVLDREAR